jgi:hypothetical protein
MLARIFYKITLFSFIAGLFIFGIFILFPSKTLAWVYPDTKVCVQARDGTKLTNGVVYNCSSCNNQSGDPRRCRYALIGEIENYCVYRRPHDPNICSGCNQECWKSVCGPKPSSTSSKLQITRYSSSGNDRNCVRMESFGYYAQGGSTGSHYCQGVWNKGDYTGVSVVHSGLGFNRRRSECSHYVFGGCVDDQYVGAYVPDYDCHEVFVNISNSEWWKKDPVKVTVTCDERRSDPVIKSISSPGLCYSSNDYTFTIVAEDGDGGKDINNIELRLKNNYRFSFSLYDSGSVSPTLAFSNPLGLTGRVINGNCGNKVCYNGNQAVLKVTVSPLNDLGLLQNINIEGRAYDSVVWSGWNHTGTFSIRKQPEDGMSWSKEPVLAGETSNLSWSRKYAPSCTLELISSVGGVHCWVDVNSPANQANCKLSQNSPGNYNCGGANGGTCEVTTDSGVLDPEWFCTAKMTLTNPCYSSVPFSDALQVLGPKPWLMTAYGDAFVYGGYAKMEMWGKSSFAVPRLGTDDADFSTYLISSNNTATTFPNRPSVYDFILSEYYDENVEIVGGTQPHDSVYEYLYELSQQNQCDASVCPVISASDIPSTCEGVHIYFVEGDLTLPGTWSKSGSDPNRACVIIAKGNVNIPFSIDSADVFILSDGKVTIEYDTDIFTLYGSIISETNRFERDLANDAVNPGQIIIYQAKYFELIEQYLGEIFPFSVKEYSYAGS